MAAEGPNPEWFSVETVNKLGAGMVFGAVAVLTLIKRGFLVFGEKVELAVKVAELTERIAYLTEELKQHQETISALKETISDLKDRLGLK